MNTGNQTEKRTRARTKRKVAEADAPDEATRRNYSITEPHPERGKYSHEPDKTLLLKGQRPRRQARLEDHNSPG